jgi:excisionase family DNA binding protein
MGEDRESPATESPGKLLTIAQAAARLGVNKKTLRTWADRGYIPHVKTPTKYRLFEPAALEEFARLMRVEPTGKLAA